MYHCPRNAFSSSERRELSALVMIGIGALSVRSPASWIAIQCRSENMMVGRKVGVREVEATPCLMPHQSLNLEK